MSVPPVISWVSMARVLTLQRLAGILFGYAAVAMSGCSNFMPEKSAREWMADGRTHSAQARWEDAIADFTEVLRLEPTSREALVLRARASLNNGDPDQALDDSKAALNLHPNDVELLRFQAHVYRRRGEFEEATKLERKAHELMPVTPDELDRRGNGKMIEGNYAGARTDFEKALKAEPHNPRYLNDMARLEAACPEANLRNGRRALEHAAEACELTQWRNPLMIDTLAAAYAETGQFDKAVETQRKATDMADLVTPREQRRLRRHLMVYQQGKPYRLGR